MTDCIFCKIARKKIPAEVITESEDLVVFKDNQPNAPIHYLIVPKKHYESFSDVSDDILIKMKEMMLTLAKEKELKAFRIVANWGDYQAVKHLHIHFTSGFKKEDY
ncbi:hypothetical protein A2897_01985 [Candidatus Woesebacteria bacterium RIFCSPLOWO2_01_FULL_44_24b]|nr:MAG: hypothetical protein A2897_01985 [Candidatus Woesebacteria bacterium RIFCSPLOWO2_01_FULL_44_24b]